MATRRSTKTFAAKFNPDSPLTGEANLMVMPNIDAANISYNLLKMIAGDGSHHRSHPARRRPTGEVLT